MNDDLLDDFDDDDEPDVTALYEPHVDGDGWQMSPRMAWHLWSAARYLAEEWRTSHPDTLASFLPRVAGPYVGDRAWRRQFAAGFKHIADGLAACGWATSSSKITTSSCSSIRPRWRRTRQRRRQPVTSEQLVRVVPAFGRLRSRSDVKDETKRTMSGCSRLGDGTAASLCTASARTGARRGRGRRSWQHLRLMWPARRPNPIGTCRAHPPSD